MLKKAVLPLTIAIIGSLSIAMLVAAKPKPVPRPAAEKAGNVKVLVLEAHKKALKLAVTAQGTVKPRREIDLVSQVSGRIERVTEAFVGGGFFDRSQVLIEIDDRDYQIALVSAEAKLAEAKRLLAEEQGLSRQAKREWRDLGNQSANDLFIRKPQLTAAKANLASAQGQVDMAQLNLERTKITVPFGGRVKEIYADLGQFVTQGARIATVYDSSILEIRLALTENQAALVDLPLSPPNKRASGSILPEVTINGLIAGRQLRWKGVLARTDAFVDSESRMYSAVVEVADLLSETTDDGTRVSLLPGLFVEATIEGKQLENVIALPRGALYKRDKVVALDADSKAIHQRVKVLRKTADTVWMQAELDDLALILLEKQSLTPAGTVIDPILNGEELFEEDAVVQVPPNLTDSQGKE